MWLKLAPTLNLRPPLLECEAASEESLQLASGYTLIKKQCSCRRGMGQCHWRQGCGGAEGEARAMGLRGPERQA
eukprot:15468379-Alexandrium_andersonii.AAC.1